MPEERYAARKLPPLLGTVTADLRALFRPALLEYQQYLKDRREYPVGSKVLNDPIWHTVRLESWEVVLLDSPLLQRLRGIHQLGLAFYVFPGAGYSRFEHSVGVLHQAQRFIDGINRNARSSGTTRLDPVQPADEILIRTAALLHDIGHGFLSHVSERALGRIPVGSGGATMKDLAAEAKAFFGCRKNPALAEILAALIVKLPETIDLFAAAALPRWSDYPDFADHLAHLIVGSTRFAHRPFLSEIISGSVDADKLDYMARDCYMAGLPMPVDVERLLQKVQVVSVLASDLPPEYETQFQLASDDLVQVFAIQEPGGRTVEELVVSRVLLYQKLYYHQKVRALEGMVENAIDLLVKNESTFRALATYLRLTDDEFLRGHWGEISTPESPETTRARALIADIANRRSVVRAFVFSSSMMVKTLTPKEGRQGWGKLLPCVGRGRTPELFAFRKRIVALARTYLEVAGDADAAGRLDEHSVVIDLPDVQGIAEKTKFWVGDEHTELDLYSDRMRVERWAEAYEAQKSFGIVYSATEHATAVHVAVRDLIKAETGLEFDGRAVSMTKVRTPALTGLIETLRSRGLDVAKHVPPSGKPRVVVHPSESELLQAHEPTLKQLASRFRSYQGAQGAAPVDASRIVQWLLQFHRDNIPHAIAVLQNIEYWDRQSIADAFVKGLSQFDLKNAELVPLGGADKSSHHLAYLIPDVRAKLGSADLHVCGSIADLKGTGHVIFFDDIAASGTQGATTMLQYFGRPQSEWETQEHIVDSASEAALEILRKSRIDFLFVTGRREGVDHIVEVTERLVGHYQVDGHVVSPSEIGSFEPAARIFLEEAHADAARAAFTDAGRAALHDKLNEGWDSEKLESRVLGYGNAAARTVFYYNVPSATLTALWKENVEPEYRWKPLFYRRTAPRVGASSEGTQGKLFQATGTPTPRIEAHRPERNKP
jgi:deoxynucleoside triphosphate triphosphohydrolase SAMHD1